MTDGSKPEETWNFELRMTEKVEGVLVLKEGKSEQEMPILIDFTDFRIESLSQEPSKMIKMEALEAMNNGELIFTIFSGSVCFIIEPETQ